MALTTAHYEQEYERAVGRTALVLEIERGREIRMQQLLLQFENDSLRLQLDETSGELVRTRESESGLRVQLSETLNEVNRLKNIVAASSHEIENLRVCCT
jgi:NAD(P)H-nitrite reductase large subunit